MKMLKFVSLFAVVCILMACVAGTAFAAGSKTDPIDITPGDGLTITEKQANDPELTKQIAADLANEKVEECGPIYQWNISASEGKTLTFSFKLASNQRGYVYHFVDGAWKKVGKLNEAITFSSFSPVGVAIFETKGTTPSGGSPKTGENGLLMSLAIAAIAMGGAVVFFSKKKD